MKWTLEQIQALADAMDQVLDDMGKDGTSTCLYTKAKARIAWEPFRDYPEDYTDEFYMTLADAKNIIDEVDVPHVMLVTNRQQ